MKLQTIRGIFFLFGLFTMFMIKESVQASISPIGSTIVATTISGGNVSSYPVMFKFSGTLDTGDVVTLNLIGSGPTLASMYTGLGGETGVMSNFNANSFADGSVLISGHVKNASGIIIIGTNVLTGVLKDVAKPTATVTYSSTGSTSGSVYAMITLSESGTITNNGGSSGYAFTSNGSFVFMFRDVVGNTGSVTATVANISGSYVGGGGSTYTPNPTPSPSQGTPIDNCVNGDTSPSLYDRVCYVGGGTVTGSVYTGTMQMMDRVIFVPAGPPSKGSIEGSPYSNEYNQAYLYAYGIGVTTMPTIQEANMKGHISRAQMAKMMARYAIVLGYTPNENKICTYNDISSQHIELQNYIILACKLNIIGNNMSAFNPNGTVTRGEIGTVLSRMLYGMKYEVGLPYYANHLKALQEAGIITSTDASIVETRANVMIMLRRATQQ